MLDRFVVVAANESNFAQQPRERTVPIPETITPVPGYPKKLVVFKMMASRYWQVRCWIDGKTHKRSCQTQSLRVAQSFARRYYELLLAAKHGHAMAHTSQGVVLNDTSSTSTKAQNTFAMLAAQMFAAEQARVERGDFTKGSLQVLRNRLDSHILPRWGQQSIEQIGYAELMTFVDFMSSGSSSTTISQYLVAIRKVFHHALRVGAIS